MVFSMISGCHFVMTDPLGLSREGDTFTYVGECEMEVEYPAGDTMIRVPHPLTMRRISWTLPRVEAAPPPIPAVPVAVVPAPLAEGVAVEPPPFAMWDYVVDSASEEPFSLGQESIQIGSDMHYSDLVQYGSDVVDESLRTVELASDSAVSDDSEDSSDCVEIITIEDSVEVIDLVSDSETEEDPSEATSTGFSFS